MVQALQPAIADWTLISLEDLPRAATITTMKQCLLEQGISPEHIHEGGRVDRALATALARHPERPLLVAGSFFTVAAVQAARADAA